MKKFVVMSGGFHPFHAGHASLYQQANEAFPDAKVLVCATNVQSDRPFPFSLKKKLAQLSGVPPKDFIEVSRQFTTQDPALAQRIGNPDDALVIYVRSDKDRNESPKPGGTKKDGTPAYFQPWTGKNVQPFGKQAYIAYLPTVEFGPGITSATEIRNAWPKLDDRRKTAMVMSLYPVTQKNPKLAAKVVKMLDMGMGNELSEGSLNEFVPPSSDRDDGGNDRNRRIRKLLEIAIQVAKEKNVDELGMIHAMNMIAGDEFFNTAVQGILPDITDKEYMFVLQSAYKTVKQGQTESSLNEFVTGNGDEESGRWYTDSELADIIGDDWFEDFDPSNDGFNMDAHGEKAKKNLVGYANAWFDDRGYNVNVLGVENNEVDHDLQWYIVGSFHNPGFAKKDAVEGNISNNLDYLNEE